MVLHIKSYKFLDEALSMKLQEIMDLFASFNIPDQKFTLAKEHLENLKFRQINGFI
jgi:hypothetical protein